MVSSRRWSDYTEGDDSFEDARETFSPRDAGTLKKTPLNAPDPKSTGRGHEKEAESAGLAQGHEEGQGPEASVKWTSGGLSSGRCELQQQSESSAHPPLEEPMEGPVPNLQADIELPMILEATSSPVQELKELQGPKASQELASDVLNSGARGMQLHPGSLRTSPFKEPPEALTSNLDLEAQASKSQSAEGNQGAAKEPEVGLVKSSGEVDTSTVLSNVGAKVKVQEAAQSKEVPDSKIIQTPVAHETALAASRGFEKASNLPKPKEHAKTALHEAGLLNNLPPSQPGIGSQSKPVSASPDHTPGPSLVDGDTKAMSLRKDGNRFEQVQPRSRVDIEVADAKLIAKDKNGGGVQDPLQESSVGPHSTSGAVQVRSGLSEREGAIKRRQLDVRHGWFKEITRIQFDRDAYEKKWQVAHKSKPRRGASENAGDLRPPQVARQSIQEAERGEPSRPSTVSSNELKGGNQKLSKTTGLVPSPSKLKEVAPGIEVYVREEGGANEHRQDKLAGQIRKTEEQLLVKNAKVDSHSQKALTVGPLSAMSSSQRGSIAPATTTHDSASWTKERSLSSRDDKSSAHDSTLSNRDGKASTKDGRPRTERPVRSFLKEIKQQLAAGSSELGTIVAAIAESVRQRSPPDHGPAGTMKQPLKGRPNPVPEGAPKDHNIRAGAPTWTGAARGSQRAVEGAGRQLSRDYMDSTREVPSADMFILRDANPSLDPRSEVKAADSRGKVSRTDGRSEAAHQSRKRTESVRWEHDRWQRPEERRDSGEAVPAARVGNSARPAPNQSRPVQDTRDFGAPSADSGTPRERKARRSRLELYVPRRGPAAEVA